MAAGLVTMAGEDAETRRQALRASLEREIRTDLRIGNTYSFLNQAFFWVALALSGIAAAIGLLDADVAKPVIGLIAATAGGLQFANRQAEFYARAYWHYRRADGFMALRNRLDFEMPLPPTPDSVAAVSKDMSKFTAEMTAETGRKKER